MLVDSGEGSDGLRAGRSAGTLASAASVDYVPCGEEHLDFLESVYASTRAEELTATGWSADVKRQFLGHQFQLQHDHYRKHYPGAEWLMVRQKGVPVGRLYLVEWPGELRVIDIALLPEARGRGIGATALGDLIAEAEAKGLAVSIHVERNNPALSLYRRLRFVKAGEHGVYDLMRREPQDQLNTAS